MRLSVNRLWQLFLWCGCGWCRLYNILRNHKWYTIGHVKDYPTKYRSGSYRHASINYWIPDSDRVFLGIPVQDCITAMLYSKHQDYTIISNFFFKKRIMLNDDKPFSGMVSNLVTYMGKIKAHPKYTMSHM